MSSESLIKTIKEKLQVSSETLKDTAETLKMAEQEKVKLRSACDEQKVKVQDVKNELKEMITAKKKAELEVKQVAQKVKDEIMADFKAIIRGLETDKYELQKAQEKANAEIKELKAQNTKLKDELWEAITKWHNIEKDLEKQFKKKDVNADEMLHVREENSQLHDQLRELQRKLKHMENEMKESKELIEGAEEEYEKFKKIIAQLKSQNGEIKE